MTTPIFKPIPACALGNLSLCVATHILNTHGDGMLHPDVYAYGRDKMLIFDRVSEDGVIENHGVLNSFIHLQYPHIGEIMRSVMKPSETMQTMIDTHWETFNECVAGFHIRRGTYSKDSAKFAYFPVASDEAVESMVKVANEMGKPVFIMSDSIETRSYFLSKVHNAVSLNLNIGFTACEHSQNIENLGDEKMDDKMNSVLEWFIMSRMPKVYTTMGGVVGRNVPQDTREGVSSTFGYSAALYGGKIPYYVFNDGYVFYPDGIEKSPRLSWSDTDTNKYIMMDIPTREDIIRVREHYGMWKVVVQRKVCEDAGILEWCKTRMNVKIIEHNETIQVQSMIEFKDLKFN
tara:strand:+ start:136 stop:1176 length:1041 start_codon:yes stop_codon:yes gene_type:complete